MMNVLKNRLNTVLLVSLLVLPLDAMALSRGHEKIMSNADYQKQILFYVNEYRAKHHLSPLVMSYEASAEAAKHSREMANHSIPFGHKGFGGRIKRLYQKNKHCRGGAENVAYYRMDAKKLVSGWIASRGHRRNIEGHYNITGIGVANSNKKGWAHFTQIFLRCDGKLA